MKVSPLLVALVLGNSCALFPQNSKPEIISTQKSHSTSDYLIDQSGILIKGTEWFEVPQVVPMKAHMKHGVAHAFTYGAVPAKAVMEYDGEHAEAVLSTGHPLICICYVDRIPGQPVLIRLHAKKNSRELVSSTAVIGVSINEASKGDLVEIAVSKPESTVWLLEPREALPPGEYAVMLGTQNMDIFPFTVTKSANPTTAQSPKRR